MIIQHNIMAINSHRQLTVNNSSLGKNLEKLSSGYRINRAGDDAAGLAISEKMRAQITGLERAKLNAQDGISLIQTAEGALTEVHSMLNRMVELATQSANGTIQESDRAKIESEKTALLDEIDRISKATNFNGIELLNGTLGKGTVSFDAGNKIQAGADLAGSGTAKVVFTRVGAQTADKGDEIASVASAQGKGGVPTDGTVGDYISFTVTNTAAGSTTTKALKIEDIVNVTNPDGTVLGIDGTVTNGATGTVDLTGVGLGLVQFTVTEAGGQDVKSLVNGLFGAGKITGEKFVPGTGAGAGLTMQVGDTAADYNMVTVSVDNMSSAGIGVAGISVLTQASAAAALDRINSAIEVVSRNRGDLGALQNRLEHTINNLGVTTENMTAAESRIRDVDMAKEMMAFTKNNVLSQAAQAMLAQANQQTQQVLQLLR